MKRISDKDLEHIYANTKTLWVAAKDSSIFITGATGFFGKWLLESFIYINKKLELNASVCALSRNPDQFLNEYPFFKNDSSITFVQGDVQSFDFPAGKFDYIIHAATDADAKLNAEDPLAMMDTIITGTRRILNFAKTQQLKSFLLTSSGAVYGQQPFEVTHTKESDSFFIDINNPVVAYAEGKRISELFCSTYYQHLNVPVKIARCFAFVGPYLPLNKHFAIGNFILNGLNGEDIIIKGDGTPYRSYLYAADLAVWLWTILFNGEDNVPYNVGSDYSVSIEDTAVEVVKHFEGINYKILSKPSGLPAARYVPCVDKAKAELGLKVLIDFEDAIKRTKLFYQ